MPALPPGPLTVWGREEHVIVCDLTKGLRSTRLDWLEVEPTYDVEVRSGETVELDIDPVAPAACRLEGLLWLDGEPPPSESAPRWSPYVERAVLDRGHFPYHVSRTDLTPEGAFTLTAAAPGTYRLYLDVPTGGAPTWTLVDRVRLELGARDWELDVPTGALRVLPREDDGRIVPFRGRLRRRGPGDVRVFVGRGETNEKTREVAFPVVPAGKVQLFQDVAGERTILLETEVVAGETTTVRIP